MTKNRLINQELKNLPQKSGVYVFKDKRGNVLYVGKAIKLKNRVISYFHSDAGKDSPRIKLMISQIADLDYTVTDNEVESLILENNYIKQLKPKYNVRLRDDKNYLFIKINLKDEIPTIVLERKIADKNARYFGPYTSSASVYETLKLIRKIFPFCTNSKVSSKPCFYYHLKKCPGVCIGKISLKDYKKNTIQKIIQFLEGKQLFVLEELKREMAHLSKSRQFEKAARIRDQIFALNQILEKQKTVYPKKVDQDVFSLYSDSFSVVNLFKVREGKLIQKENFILENTKQTTTEEIFKNFLTRYYLDADSLPKEIILNDKISDRGFCQLLDLRSPRRRIKILTPSKGVKLQLLKLGEENARQYLQTLSEKSVIEEVKLLNALKELQKILNLDRLPARIEAYDISNIQGKNAVGSMIVFDYARPKKQDYRKFKIKLKDTPDDFAMMAEVLFRRFAKSSTNQTPAWPLPDLVLIDGGKGQLTVAKKILNKYKLNIPVIGLAKRLEEIFIPNQSRALNVPNNSPALFLLQRIRDEAHRFAITFHRKQRLKELTSSLLDDIPGIGDVKKRLLLKKFGSTKNIKKAGLTEISAITGRKLAKKIKAII